MILGTAQWVSHSSHQQTPHDSQIIVLAADRLYIPWPFYTTCGALAGMRNSSKDLICWFDPVTHHTMSGWSTMEIFLAPID